MNIPKPYLVGPHKGSWVVLQSDPHVILSSHKTQRKAWKKALRLAKEHSSESVLYSKTGKIRLHKSYRPLADRKEQARRDSEFYRVMNHDETDPDSWWFHPKEKDYFDWLNAGVDQNRVMVIFAFGMDMFNRMVTIDFSELPKYINDPDTEVASLARYRLERGLV